ncbi:MAG: hypothetical protein ACRBDI_00020 [Alphaproteobacteria bacterium]
MSLIDNSNIPNNSADVAVDLRKSFLDISPEDLIELADGRGPKSVGVYKPSPAEGSLSHSFFVATGAAEERLIERQSKFADDDFRKAIASDILRSLTDGQSQTPENYVRARDLALELSKVEVFEKRDSEFQDTLFGNRSTADDFSRSEPFPPLSIT